MRELKSASPPYLLFAAVALLLGVYARFKGLGYAPVSADEYYLARGIDGILKHGYPAYECGGIYQRGLLIQYSAAGLRLMGLSIEYSARIICVISSLLVLPASYLIARRITTVNGALLAVGILALSVWEIEIARFGRMYAPFQAIFAWYLVYLLRYTVDGDERAMKPMLALNVVGIFVWEGSVFLALAGLVPSFLSLIDNGRLSRRDYVVIASSAVLLVLGYVMGTVNLRYTSDMSPYPDGYVQPEIDTQSFLAAVHLPQLSLHSGWGWPAAFVAVAALAVLSLRWILEQKKRPIAALGLFVVLAAALAHQFVIVLLAPVILVLLNQLSLADFRSRGGSIFLLAVLLTMLFWIAHSAAMIDWPAAIATAGNPVRAIASLGYQFVAFPNVVGVVAKPFAKAVPHLSLLLFVGLAIALVQSIRSDETVRAPRRFLLLLVALLLLGVGVVNPDREETRYVAFLFPSVIILVLGATLELLVKIGRQRAVAATAGSLLACSLFAATEDINFRHITRIDSPEITFRTGMSPAMEAHLEIRDDLKSIARWLQVHATSPDTLVITGVHGFDYYYKHAKYFFIDQSNPTFHEFSCRRGTVERWTNLPLIYSFDDLKAHVRPAGSVYLVTFTPTPEQMQLLASVGARILKTDGLVSLIGLGAAAGG